MLRGELLNFIYDWRNLQIPVDVLVSALTIQFITLFRNSWIRFLLLFFLHLLYVVQWCALRIETIVLTEAGITWLQVGLITWLSKFLYGSLKNIVLFWSFIFSSFQHNLASTAMSKNFSLFLCSLLFGNHRQVINYPIAEMNVHWLQFISFYPTTSSPRNAFCHWQILIF